MGGAEGTFSPEHGAGLAALVRAWRERAQMTQEQLAGRINMSDRWIRMLESGNAGPPRGSSLEQLATALSLSEAERAALIAAARRAANRRTREGATDRTAALPSGPSLDEVPRQLPVVPLSFTGRVTELAVLHRIPDATAVVITSIDGMAGVGKTALAVHAAHQMAGLYPDGQLFMDLHGYTEGVAPVEPGDALDRMLRILGVPGERIPHGLDDRAALYRSRLADRRVLVLLDNAASEAQVAPLFPGTSGCLVMVTSRRRMTDLDHTHVVSLDVLPLRDAVALFAATAGPDRTADASSETLSEIVELCGQLPLAVRIAAARLRTRPGWNTEILVERLRDHRHRLDELEAGQRSVHAALELSCRDLDPETRRGYRLLGLHPGADFDSYAVAALLEVTVRDAARLTDRLLDAHLLQEPTAGRFSFHDLVRDHARAASTSESTGDETEADNRAATARLLDYYRDAASEAMNVAYPHALYRRPEVPPARTPIPTMRDAVRAGAWLDGELSNLIAAAQHGAEHGWPDHPPHLSATLHLHLRDRGHIAEAAVLHEHALVAARASANHAGEADALALLGLVRWLQGRLEKAGELLELALVTARTADHPLAEVTALTTLGYVRAVQGAHIHAIKHFELARESARRISDYGTELEALYGLAYLHMQHGEPAVDEFEECLALARAAGDSTGERMALQGLGHAHRTHSRLEQAIDCFEQALRIARAGGNERGNPGTLVGLAHAHKDLGHDAAAADYYRQVLSLAKEIGNPNWEFEGTQGLGRLECAAGRLQQALARHQQALDIATQLGQLIDEVRAHDGLAHAYRAQGHQEHARRHWQRALDILVDLGTDVTEANDVTTDSIRSHLSKLDQPSADSAAQSAPF